MITPRELATELGVHVVTLCRWRREGYGPEFVRVGSGIRYRRRDVDAWLKPAPGRRARARA